MPWATGEEQEQGCARKGFTARSRIYFLFLPLFVQVQLAVKRSPPLPVAQALRISPRTLLTGSHAR